MPPNVQSRARRGMKMIVIVRATETLVEAECARRKLIDFGRGCIAVWAGLGFVY